MNHTNLLIFRLSVMVLILSLLMIPAVYSAAWSSTNTYLPLTAGTVQPDAYQQSAPTAGTPHMIVTRSASTGPYTVVLVATDGTRSTYSYYGPSAPATIPGNAAQGWVASGATVLNAPAAGTGTASNPTSAGGTRGTGSSTPVVQPYLVNRQGTSPVLVTVTTTNGQTTYQYQVVGGGAATTTSYELPAGTNVDWSRFNPAAPQNVPLSGGGTRIVTDRTHYEDRDATDRQIRIVGGGVTRTFTYQSSDRGTTASPNADYTQAKSTEVTVDGVPGRLTIQHNEQGVSALDGTGLDTPQAYRAALEAGITTIDTPQVTRRQPNGQQGRARIVSGSTTILTTSTNDVAAYDSNGYRLYIASTDVTRTTIPGQTNTAGTVYRVEGDAVAGGIDRNTGEFKRDNLPANAEYTESLFTPGTADPNDNDAGRMVVRSRRSTDTTVATTITDIDYHTGQFRELNENGQAISGRTHHFAVGSDAIKRQTWTGLAVPSSPEFNANNFATQIERQFGPNAVVVQYRNTNTLNINGRFYYRDVNGNLEGCGVIEQCPGIEGSTPEERSAEMDRFESQVVDPQLRAQGRPSTNALQIAQSLADFRWYSNAYQGFSGFSSIMFSEEFLADWRGKIDEVMCDMLHIGGTACWTSQVCDIYTDIEQPQGTLVGSTPDGSPRSIAHIQGEKSPPITFEGATRKTLIDVFGEKQITVQGNTYNLADEDVDLTDLPPITAHVYKVTLSFNPTQNSQLNVEFRGERSAKWFAPDLAVQAGQPYSRIRSNPILFISPTNYDQVCLVFNPGQETRGGVLSGGRSVNSFCTPISEYDGAAVAPVTIASVNDSSVAQPGAGSADPSQPSEGGNI